ncbi:MAG: hypothetical protein WAM82_08600 [Thermoanaerobaculia bacterium]
MSHHHHLLHRKLGRILGGAALIVALSMAFPAGAHAAGAPSGIWRWIEGLLADRIGEVIRWGTPAAASPSPAVQAKDAVCPPACPPPPPPPPPPAPNQGGGLDPDGK